MLAANSTFDSSGGICANFC